MIAIFRRPNVSKVISLNHLSSIMLSISDIREFVSQFGFIIIHLVLTSKTLLPPSPPLTSTQWTECKNNSLASSPIAKKCLLVALKRQSTEVFV